MTTRTRMFRIYLIQNTVSGRAYVGVTSQTVSCRWKEHCSDARRGDRRPLYLAMRKYGLEAFVVRQITVARTWDQGLRLEQRHIARLGTLTPRGYNLTIGGEGTLGYTWRLDHPRRSAAARQRVSEQAKARHADPAFRSRWLNRLRRSVRTPEYRKKKSQASRAWHADPSKNRRHRAALASSVVRKKLARATEALWCNVKWKARQVATRRSRQFSARQSQAVRSAYTDPVKRRKLVRASTRTIERVHREHPTPHATTITLDGVRYPSIAAAARALGLSYNALTGRLYRAGISGGRQSIQVAGHRYPSAAAAMRALGCSRGTIQRWLRTGRAQRVPAPKQGRPAESGAVGPKVK